LSSDGTLYCCRARRLFHKEGAAEQRSCVHGFVKGGTKALSALLAAPKVWTMVVINAYSSSLFCHVVVVVLYGIVGWSCGISSVGVVITEYSVIIYP
jgi:hypothetical protein